MLIVMQYATIAKHVYGITNNLFSQRAEYSEITASTTNISANSKAKDIKTFIINAPNNWARVTDFDHVITPSDDFYGGIYIKFEHGKAVDVVVSYRGTVLFGHPDNDIVDMRTWFSDAVGDGKHDTIPKYFAHHGPALDLYQKAKFYVREHFPHLHHKIKVTGHSLGGALAQLIVALTQYPTMAVTFNAPGIGDIPGVNPGMAYRIHNVNSRYGFINKIGNVLGSIDYVDVPEAELLAKEVLTAHHTVEDIEREIAEHKLNTLEMFASMLLLHNDRQIEAADGPIAIYPQHSMDNLLKAISKNSQIAHKSFAA